MRYRRRTMGGACQFPGLGFMLKCQVVFNLPRVQNATFPGCALNVTSCPLLAGDGHLIAGKARGTSHRTLSWSKAQKPSKRCAKACNKGPAAFAKSTRARPC